jgi:hypothetical protein
MVSGRIMKLEGKKMFHSHLRKFTDLALALVAGFLFGIPVGAKVTLGYEKAFTGRYHVTSTNRVDVDTLNVNTFIVGGKEIYVIGDYHVRRR